MSELIIDVNTRNRIIEVVKKIEPVIESTILPNDSLFSGNLGLVVYYYCNWKVFRIDAYFHKAIGILEEIMERVKCGNSSLRTFHISIGLSGLGAVLNFLLQEDVIDFNIEEELSIIDEFIIENALYQTNDGYVEYLHGGGGALQYFNMRKATNKIVNNKHKIINSILLQIEKNPLKVHIPRSRFSWTSGNDFDLSLSHGLCGILLILLNIVEANVLGTDARIIDYLQRAAQYVSLLKRPIRMDEGYHSFFPSYISPNLSSDEIHKISNWPDSRLAWCYGDLGWVFFFYKIGRYLGNTAYIDLANEVGIASTIRKTSIETGSTSSHFCHGHSGLAYFYRKLFILNGSQEYKESCEYWLKLTIEQTCKELENKFYQKDSIEGSFLEGLVGINLVLISFVSEENLEWEKFLLL